MKRLFPLMVAVAACQAQPESTVFDGKTGDDTLVMNVLADDIIRADIAERPFCHANAETAGDMLANLLARPDFSGHQPRWYDGSGLSPATREGDVFAAVYLSRRDLRVAAEEIDDELDLNFDHYGPEVYMSHGIGTPITVGPCDSEYRVSVALSMKEEIGPAYYMSESDYLWVPVYTEMRIDRGFPVAQVKAALGADVLVDVWSHSESEQFLEWQGEDDEEGHFYRQLHHLLAEGSYNFRVIKVGEVDSGALDLYILVRLRSGHLAGLRTITVET